MLLPAEVDALLAPLPVLVEVCSVLEPAELVTMSTTAVVDPLDAAETALLVVAAAAADEPLPLLAMVEVEVAEAELPELLLLLLLLPLYSALEIPNWSLSGVSRPVSSKLMPNPKRTVLSKLTLVLAGSLYHQLETVSGGLARLEIRRWSPHIVTVVGDAIGKSGCNDAVGRGSLAQQNRDLARRGGVPGDVVC